MVLSPAHPDASVFDSEAASSARMIAWFSELGAVFIPTVGFFIRSQAFFPPSATEQSLAGLSRGSKTLLNLGFPQEEAKRLGRELSDFGALVYIPCSESAKAETAIQVLQNLGPREVSDFGAGKGRCRGRSRIAVWQAYKIFPPSGGTGQVYLPQVAWKYAHLSHNQQSWQSTCKHCQ